MDIQKIKVILSAIEHNSLSRAAEEISYTPSALSHIADAIDRELGVKILQRTPLGISLTPEGQEIYPHLLAIVEAEKNLLRVTNSVKTAKENHLRIGTFSSISQELLPEIISKFRLAHPEIKISVSVEDNLQDWLEYGLVDVIFADQLCFGENEWIPIKEDPFVAVFPEGMLNGKKVVSKEELYDHTYISINEKLLEPYFDQTKFPNVVNFESVDNVSVLYMIKQGLGFSVLPSLMTNKKIKGIKTLKLDPPVSRTIGFAYKKDGKLSHGAKLFIDYLLKKDKP